MTEVLALLSEEQINNLLITDIWTPKDVISHLTEWNIEYVKEIDNILNDNPTWQELYESEEGTNKLNEKSVVKRRTANSQEIIKEWHEAFDKLLEKIKNLTEEEWLYESSTGVWTDGKPITVNTIFEYTYNGLSHEAGHAEKIRGLIR